MMDINKYASFLFVGFQSLSSPKPFSFLSLFLALRFLLPSIRFNFEACVGEVDFLSGTGVRIFARRLKNFSSAFLLFISWLRSDCEIITISPSDVILFLRAVSILFFSSPLSEGDPDILNLSSILVFTLFTFCPPGPLLLVAVNLSSDEGILSFSSSGFIIDNSDEEQRYTTHTDY